MIIKNENKEASNKKEISKKDEITKNLKIELKEQKNENQKQINKDE